MHMTNILCAGQRDIPRACPECGGCQFEDNRLDERLYIEAAKEAPRLRYEGHVNDAIDVLSALYSIRIINFIRARWRCECGATFDD